MRRPSPARRTHPTTPGPPWGRPADRGGGGEQHQGAGGGQGGRVDQPARQQLGAADRDQADQRAQHEGHAEQQAQRTKCSPAGRS
ncbi:hypothetical protein [Solwaraspora sp. WMMD792]|uniref:hypothetical protein n=1 Tax=Solwaraspora sp. WMMD792 TaxID=3016099 RepID=UPI00241642A3|nr:hypothetical protein [Solwaraspora sp. WMMD792]MDG4768745.1 hypothetical protein [Solwaraspora sp. WMMD792]MDG4768784.1 hypothetical protein [Solwaraspora sp. WMMD792]MDG4768860.1 hypothetical protein [Solwaraspora sp. WMMD792]MDG4768921.1 hypothetical protein [Solwaraspora sp. WMMD792]MDG4769031.1 hypothetical protein [Solwaraspora sp. WMMD792]